MKTYFEVYKKFFITSLAEASSFRTSFILIILMDIIFYLTTLSTVSFIYDHVSTIGPWNKDQLMFFIAFMLTMDHLHMTIVSENFWELSVKIRTGTLDFDLLRPLSSIFSVFFRYVRTSSLVNTPLVWGMLIYFGNKLNLTWAQWAVTPPLIILGFSLFVIIEFCLSVAMFWTIEGWGINFLRMQLQQLARWPHFIYSYFPRKILTLCLPILLVGSGPVNFIYDFSNTHLLMGALVALAVSALFLKYLWAFALTKYDSPSS
jgi:ABC-2 type transport system permease protein